MFVTAYVTSSSLTTCVFMQVKSPNRKDSYGYLRFDL